MKQNKAKNNQDSAAPIRTVMLHRTQGTSANGHLQLTTQYTLNKAVTSETKKGQGEEESKGRKERKEAEGRPTTL